ncbi:MAG: cysteine--tRNA ligase [Oscillospiraceae bacterium]
MKLYNTFIRDKEEFVPLTPGKVSLYACGPTVYNYIHIGNARPISVFDTLRRYLEYKGYEVTFVQNFTDVDDKIINKANQEGVESSEIARRYMEEFLVDAEGLGIRPPTVAPKATETMDEIIDMVKTLVEKGYAYEKNGDVYFRSRKFDSYGALSHQPLEDLEAGKRISVSSEKEDELDFAVWKSAKPGEPSWDSPWGKGRPGWHIECSAMIKKHLGDTIDIHGGGQDLIFPHHENERAQSCCANADSETFVRYWMHNGYINVDNQKMSKSLGNFFTVRDVAEKFGYEPIKFMLLAAHYRSPLNYSYEVIEQSKAALERLYTCRDNLDFALEKSVDTPPDAEFIKVLEAHRTAFEEAMDDDLNTAGAMGALFELVKDCNIHFAEPRARADAEAAISLFDLLCGILGLLYNRKKSSLDGEVEALIAERQQARKDKNFARADEIRDSLAARGIVLEDTPQGVKWREQ